MKLKNLFFASVAVAGLFSACSNEMDEIVDNNGGNQPAIEGSAYASFSLQFPAATRALDTEEVGTTEENAVKEVTLLFFEETAGTRTLKDIKTLNSSAFTKGSTNTYTTNEAFLVTKGTRYIYAFVNAQAKIKALSPSSDNGAAWATVSGVGTETVADLSSATGFAMSNAETAPASSLIHATAAAAQASPITIPVERSVAKVMYVGNNQSFEIKRSGDGVKVGSVNLTDFTLVNGNTKYYYLKRVGDATGMNTTIGGAETITNYVIDPNFTLTSKTEEADLSYTATQELAKDATFYCQENTMSAAGQYNGATTGVMFKAKVTVADQAADGTFYRYNGAIYATAEAVKKAANIPSNVNPSTVEDWATYKVDYYAEGVCYYPYWIKHQDNNDPASMGIMEFGVVRNNVYKLSVSKINEIGAPTDKIDPENPDESEKVYLSVSVEIKPWTIRPNLNIEL